MLIVLCNKLWSEVKVFVQEQAPHPPTQLMGQLGGGEIQDHTEQRQRR